MARMSPARREADRLLLGGAWHPLTQTLTFFAADVEECVAGFMDWLGLGALERTGHPLRRRDLTGDLEALLAELVPMEMRMGLRTLFIPVATDGPYRTMMLKSSWQGTDPISEKILFGSRGVGSVTIQSCPDNPAGVLWPGRFYGIHEFGALWPVSTEEDPRGFTGRSVGVRMHGKWIFVDLGHRLPFEDTTSYTAHRVRERFTQQTLIDYAAAVGLRPFDADFYAPDRTAVLVEHTGPAAVWGERLVSLADARSGARNTRELGIPHPQATTVEPESRTVHVIDGIAHVDGKPIWDPKIPGTRPPPGWTPET